MKLRSLLLFFLSPFVINAQDSVWLDSREAVRIALENNLDIKIVKGDLDIATINNTWGNAGKWPTVNANFQNTQAITNLNQELSNGSTTKRNGVNNNVLTANLNAQWRIYNGHRVRATKQ